MVSQSLLRRVGVCNGRCVSLIRDLDLHLVAGLERAFQFRGLVDMQPDFMAGFVMHRIELALDFQHVPSVIILEPLMARWTDDESDLEECAD